MIVVLACAAVLLTGSVHAEEPRIRAELGTPGPVLVGQRVRVYVHLMTPSTFRGSPRFDLPRIPHTLILKLDERPVPGTERVEGVTFSVLRYEFALFAQRAGPCVIAPFEVRFGVAGEVGSDQVEHRFTTRELRFEVERPPGTEGIAVLVCTNELTVTESWSPQPGDARVGDAFTRTIEMVVEGVPAMALPPLPLDEVSGIGVYPKAPIVVDHMERGAFTGRRVQTVTYLCERPGPVTLPALSIPWWDLDGSELAHSELPSVRFEVAPSAAGSSNTVVEAELRWGWPTTLMAIAVLGGVAFAGARRRAIASWLDERRKRRAASESGRFAALRRAMRGGDAAAVLAALYAWLDVYAGGDRTVTLRDLLAEHPDRELERELEELQAAATRVGAAWSGRSFEAVLSRVRSESATIASATPSLPPLNPIVCQACGVRR